MNINHNINTTILTDNNTSVLAFFYGEEIINSLDDLKNIKGSFIVINDVLHNLKEKDLSRLFKSLEENNIHFVNITSNVEEALYSSKMIVYMQGKVEIEGPVLSVLKEEKLLKHLGFSLPFMFDLSLQLGLYGVVDGIFLDEKVLVDKLW